MNGSVYDWLLVLFRRLDCWWYMIGCWCCFEDWIVGGDEGISFSSCWSFEVLVVVFFGIFCSRCNHDCSRWINMFFIICVSMACWVVD